MWKEDEIKLGVELGVDFVWAWTCYDPQIEKKSTDGVMRTYVVPCKKCLSCVERMDAFKKAGVRDEQYE